MGDDWDDGLIEEPFEADEEAFIASADRKREFNE